MLWGRGFWLKLPPIGLKKLDGLTKPGGFDSSLSSTPCGSGSDSEVSSVGRRGDDREDVSTELVPTLELAPVWLGGEVFEDEMVDNGELRRCWSMATAADGELAVPRLNGDTAGFADEDVGMGGVSVVVVGGGMVPRWSDDGEAIPLGKLGDDDKMGLRVELLRPRRLTGDFRGIGIGWAATGWLFELGRMGNELLLLASW